MSSPSPRKGKGREMEKTTPEQIDGTVDDTANELDSLHERMRYWRKISTRNNQPRSYTLDRKAGTMQTSTSPTEASSDNSNNNNTNDYQLHSTTQDDSVYSNNGDGLVKAFFDNGEGDVPWQPSRSRTSWERSSDQIPGANEPKDFSKYRLLDTSDDTVSEDSRTSFPKPETSFSTFRQCGELSTRHVYSGKMRGKRRVYDPMYTRDRDGHLYRLEKDKRGNWEYMKVDKLYEYEEEAIGLELFKDPKAKRN